MHLITKLGGKNVHIHLCFKNVILVSLKANTTSCLDSRNFK